MNAEYTLYVRRYAPFASFGGGFEGDDRVYSTNPSATARTAAVVAFGPSGPGKVDGFSDGSAYVGPWAVRRSVRLGAIGKHIGQVRVRLSGASAGDGKVKFTVYSEGNLPLKDVMFHKTPAGWIDKANAALRPKSPNPQFSPDIDTFIDFSATFTPGSVLFEGTMRGDGFPHAEVFVRDHATGVAGLLDYRTKSGAMGPLYRLYFSGVNNRLASFSRRVSLKPDGSFGGDAAAPPPITLEK